MFDFLKLFKKKLQGLLYPNWTPTSYFFIIDIRALINLWCHLVSSLLYIYIFRLATFLFRIYYAELRVQFLRHVFNEYFMTVYFLFFCSWTCIWISRIMTTYLIFKIESQRSNVLAKMENVLISFSLGLFARRGF